MCVCVGVCGCVWVCVCVCVCVCVFQDAEEQPSLLTSQHLTSQFVSCADDQQAMGIFTRSFLYRKKKTTFYYYDGFDFLVFPRAYLLLH